MEYQKLINLLDNTTNQPSKLRTRNWVEINDEQKEKCDNSNIRIKTSMIRSIFCDYSYSCIFVKGSITVPNKAAAGSAVNNTNKEVIFKPCALFTDCITERNNTKVDVAQNIDVVLPMYNLIEYSDAYSKTPGSLWQYCTEDPALDNDSNVTDFSDDNNNSASFTFKQKITEQTGNVGTKDVEIMVPLKYLSYFWRTLEMHRINCNISFPLKWSRNCIIVAGTVSNEKRTFQIMIPNSMFLL